MKTDKISFGTNPSIGYLMADVGLPKYKINLTEGLFDAFEKLSKNNTGDELIANLGINKNAKSSYTDVLEFSYKLNDAAAKESTKSFSPRVLEKLSKKEISKLILKTYKQLITSGKKSTIAYGIPNQNSEKTIHISKQHKLKIDKLVKKYGRDDSSLLI